jgi:oleandomycin transport system permease protein
VAGGSQHDYLQFLLPGMLGQTIAMSSVAIGQNMNADIAKGVFDRFRSLPIARAVPLIGAVLADFIRYAIVCVVTLGFGYLIGFRVETDPLKLLAALGLAVCFALSFAWVSVFVGMTVRTAGAVQGIMFLLIFPLSFGSNTFVRPTTMPGWLQAFVNVNPLSHLVSAVRGLLLGGPVGSQVAWTLGWCAALLVVFFPLALRGYIRRALFPGGGVILPGGGMVPGPLTLQLSAEGSATARGVASSGGSAKAGRRKSSMSSIGRALASR